MNRLRAMWVGTNRKFQSLFAGAWIKDRVAASSEYKNAVDFSKSYEPNAHTNYDWVLTHAVKEYEHVSARVDGLDAKADALIGYLGAGSGLISLALAYGLGSHPATVLWTTVPTLALLLAAMICALLSRMPAKMPTLPHAKDALSEADRLAKGAEGKFSACVWMSSAALSLAAREKANLVRRAFLLFGIAITWLVCSALFVRLVVGH